MNEVIKNVELKFACSENWEAMNDAEGGKHCDKCQKKVYDFRNSKADEFIKILAENKGNICGHFNAEQVVHKYIPIGFWKRWVPAVVIFTGLTLFACNEPKKKIIMTTGIILPPLPDSLKNYHNKSRVECTEPATQHTAFKPEKNN